MQSCASGLCRSLQGKMAVKAENRGYIIKYGKFYLVILRELSY